MKKSNLLLIFFFLVGIISRLPLIEKFQSHWDGPQYSIGIINYNLLQETPSPPGYPLYIAMGRFFYEFVHDPHYALLLVGVLFSGIGAVLIYSAGRTMFNNVVGFIAALLFLSGPTFYFFGLTAYAYGIIPIIATALAWSVYLIIVKKRKIGLILGMLFALAVGIRPQEFPMLIPLAVLGVYFLPNRQKIFALLGFIITTSVWLIPFLYIVGGLKAFIYAFSIFIQQGAIDSVTFNNSLQYSSRILKGIFLTFTISIFFLGYYFSYVSMLFKKNQVKRIIHNKKVQLFLAWIAPSFLVNLFIRSDHAGYQMTFLSSLLMLIAYAQHQMYKKNKAFLVLVVASCVVFNLFWFFRDRDPRFNGPYIPTSFHYSEIRKNDIKLGAKVDYIDRHFNPENTLIIVGPELWRPLMYHLKPFRIYSMGALVTNETRFKDIIRISKDWSREEKKIKIRELIIPDKITTIVFADDNASIWVKNTEKQTIILPANSRITMVKVDSYQLIKYSLRSINLQ